MSDDSHSKGLFLLITYLKGMMSGINLRQNSDSDLSAFKDLASDIMADFQTKNNKSSEEDKCLNELSHQINNELCNYIDEFIEHLKQAQKETNA